LRDPDEPGPDYYEECYVEVTDGLETRTSTKKELVLAAATEEDLEEELKDQIGGLDTNSRV
jgi:hypothetical protein